MYQPYIRGKQFELIGIKELIVPVLLNNLGKISPIIEPVKDSSTFKTTLRELAKNNVNFTIIINPQVGSFNDPEKILDLIQDALSNYNNFQVGVIFHAKINHKGIIDILNKFSNLKCQITLIHNCVFDNISEIIGMYNQPFVIKFNIVNLKLTSKRYFRNFAKTTLVELDDYFDAQSRNSDYLSVGESDFSEEHLFYKEEGFIGFSDYLTIGEEFSESGFLPYAVAIHLSYSDNVNRIKIKHFVSDTNQDTSDIAGKFEEALNKLIEWCNINRYNSISIPFYRQYHTNGHFPGLGTLKKLSLMNHIDLVLKLI